MKILEPLFKNVISELIENNVLFILIGGYAVNYYGYGRYTGDIATKTILKKLKT